MRSLSGVRHRNVHYYTFTAVAGKVGDRVLGQICQVPGGKGDSIGRPDLRTDRTSLTPRVGSEENKMAASV